jgi:flagellar biosynthesis activator protein FlaF
LNASEQARLAYAPAISSLRSGRAAELQIMTQSTARLRAAAEKAGNFPRLAQAIHENRQLWTRLAADVADTENGLPCDLRAQIFYLAEFTHAHSSRVLRGQADVTALIDINTAVMRGLSASAPRMGVA